MGTQFFVGMAIGAALVCLIWAWSLFGWRTESAEVAEPETLEPNAERTARLLSARKAQQDAASLAAKRHELTTARRRSALYGTTD